MMAESEVGGPLAGLRVLEFAGLGAAPYGVMLLADLGADVTRVDRPGARSDASTIAHVAVARGRRSIIIDLKHPDASMLVRRLVAQSDVLVEGYRPGTMERLGLGPDDMCAAHPQLVYARMTGWGQTGPLAMTAGHDINYAALAGALHTVGPSDRPPPPVVNYLADHGGGGMLLAVGILAALFERERSGCGQLIDAAMVDGVASLTTFVRGLVALSAWSETRGANLLDGGTPYYATYACADGRYVAVGAIEPKFFRVLVDGLGLPAWARDAQHDTERRPELRDAIAARFAQEPRAFWVERFEGTDACVTPVLALGEVAEHPHHRARAGFAVPLVGAVPPSAGGSPMPSPAPRLSRTPGMVRGGAPEPGADTRGVLTAAGLDAAAVDDLIVRGVVAER